MSVDAILAKIEFGRQLWRRNVRQRQALLYAHGCYSTIPVQDRRVVAPEREPNGEPRTFRLCARPPHGVLTQLADARRPVFGQNLFDRKTAARCLFA